MREVKRLRTERRISRCAQQLTEERGLDGFTLDDLAARAEVSRRTLFNYFPSKLDAVLGPVPAVSDAARTAFLAGGPTGRLIDDSRPWPRSCSTRTTSSARTSSAPSG